MRFEKMPHSAIRKEVRERVEVMLTIRNYGFLKRCSLNNARLSDRDLILLRSFSPKVQPWPPFSCAHLGISRSI